MNDGPGPDNEGLLTTAELASLGMTTAEIDRAVRDGGLVRLRRGVYTSRLPEDPVARHLLLVAATVRESQGAGVISHLSAAVCHGLEVPWASLEDRVHVTRERGGTSRRPRLVSHVASIPVEHRGTHRGWPVTSVPWTVVDCARLLGFAGGLAVADSALRLATAAGSGSALRAAFTAALDAQQGRHGLARARAAVAYASPLAESAGESISRAVLKRAGLPEPVLQHEIRTAAGAFVARTDLAWLRDRTVGEFDGALKYRRGNGNGDAPDPGRVVYREKRREDAIRDLGWEVVRWGWADLEEPESLAARIRVAMRRGRRRNTG